ncbi:hypothetical protein NQ315_015592 [Exocentrus adspersus]|uniref:Probable ribosome biogenesis protein RLP24 n=1 Tax=Exocentrus adspersus TaxID=1586481 RepID=A0AAV8V5L4_9CUCU|nr:hypothetical protein NQ315_015592 [Exocentrus adspersus]
MHKFRSKCYKLFKRKWNPRKTKWTKTYRMLKKKSLYEDEILKLEKKIDEPLVVDKQILNQTIEVIPQYIEKRMEREDFFVMDRILTQREKEKENEIKFIEKHKHLLEDREAKKKVIKGVIIGKKKEKETKTIQEYEIN